MSIIKNIICIIGILSMIFWGWVFFSNPEDEMNTDDMYYYDEYDENYIEPYQLL